VFYDQKVHNLMSKPKDRASELFMEGMEFLLPRRGDGKRFHDPVAAVCHLHPEVGKWIKGKIQKIEGGWGTVADESGDYVLADLDRPAFWRCIQNWQ
jgi:pyrimidine-specific ribonucleoside hydrolase